MMDWLTTRTQATPHKLALTTKGQSLTYQQLHQLTNSITHNLLHNNIQPTQRIAVLMHNCTTYVGIIHALARLGAVLVPLNTRLTPDELRWQLSQTACEWLIYHDETAVLTPTLPTPTLHANTLTQITPTPTQPNHTFDLNDLQAIVFTSGTTGYPKGVMLTFANHFWSATASAYRLGLHPDDCWLSCLPLYHVGGLAVIFRSCLYGTAVNLHAKFNLEAVNHSLDHEPITLISVVPTMLYRLLATRSQWPRSLRLLLLGGAAASADLIAQCQANNIPIATTYGLTEAASQVATMLPDAVAKKPGSVGKPLMFTTVRIADEAGHSLPTGTYGQLLVSGPTVMAGYYQNEAATQATIRHQELYTGDIGYLDADGDLWLVQRRRDIIVTGGENVYPAEVERVLRQHTAVANACVVGIPDPEWGQRVVALVALQPHATLTPTELINYSRQHLAGYKQPRHIRFIAHLPLTASGKIARRAVETIMKEGG